MSVAVGMVENLEYVLPIRYTEDVEQFRENLNTARPLPRP